MLGEQERMSFENKALDPNEYFKLSVSNRIMKA